MEKDQFSSKHKKKCQYCGGQSKCRACGEIVNCKEITDCYNCGGIYGRPLDGPVSGGCLMIEYFGTIPYIHLIMEVDIYNNLKSEFSDPGGKYDCAKDMNIIETCLREFKEETGMLLLSVNDLYVNIGDSYVCYIVVNTYRKQFILTGIPPEAAPIKMKVSQFLNLRKKDKSMFSHRLNLLMESHLQTTEKKGVLPKLKNYLSKLI